MKLKEFIKYFKNKKEPLVMVSCDAQEGKLSDASHKYIVIVKSSDPKNKMVIRYEAESEQEALEICKELTSN